MYRVTTYDNDGNKTVDEIEDVDELREYIDLVRADIEDREIKTFSVSWLSGKTYKEPFWEKGV